jgi:hypothetical protein
MSAAAWSEEPELPTDPTDPNYEKELQTYIDYQMKNSKKPVANEDDDEDKQLEAMRKKALKVCLDDPESAECKKYRKLHSEILKFGLETMDTVMDHQEEKQKKKETKPKK